MRSPFLVIKNVSSSISHLMYILTSDFFKKDAKYVSKAIDLCCVEGIFRLLFIFVYQKS